MHAVVAKSFFVNPIHRTKRSCLSGRDRFVCWDVCTPTCDSIRYHALCMPDANPPSSSDIKHSVDAFRADVAAVREQIGRVIVGQTAVIEGVLTALLCGGHVLLEGVPGVGKTLLIRTLSRALTLSFGRVQFTPDLMPADVTGTTIVVESDDSHGRRQREFKFQPGPVFAQILLADEINRATPKTQSALLEAMAERSVTVGGTSHQLPSPFLVMATQNPVEQEGTYPLPEAQLDRFFFKLLVPSPSRQDLARIVARTTGGDELSVQPVLDAAKILQYQQLVRAVPIVPHVRDFAVRLTLGTHPKATGGVESYATPLVEQFVRLGASPRAAQALVLAAKCRALLQGRHAASIDDLRAAAAPTLRHRLIMNFEALAQGVTADAVIENLAMTLPVDAPGVPQD